MVRLIVRTIHFPAFGTCPFLQWPQRVYLVNVPEDLGLDSLP
jgi:hypothetical protein